MMDTDDEFCLKWNNHHSTFMTVLHSLLKKEILVDVTLAAEGQFIEAHKLVLSTCSEYFQDALQIHDNKHAYIFLNNVAFDDLKALIEYMYLGEVNVSQEQLPRFLASAEALKIKGLSERGETSSEHLEQFIPIQARVQSNSGKSGKSANRQTTNTSQTARQIRQSLQQQHIPSSSSHPITTQPEAGQSNKKFQTPSELVPDTEVTPEVNFVSVNSHGEEIDIGQNEENGLGTLSKVWSLNQDNEVGDWDNTEAILSSNPECCVTQEERYVSPSESDNSEYRHYAEANVNPSTVGDLMSSPSSSSSTRGKNKWASTSGANATYSGPVKVSIGKPIGSNNSGGGDSWRKTVAKNKQLGKPVRFSSSVFRKGNNSATVDCLSTLTCPNCGRGYSQKGSLNRHLKFECGIVPKFPCQLCPMRFRRAYKLTEHHNRVHLEKSNA